MLGQRLNLNDMREHTFVWHTKVWVIIYNVEDFKRFILPALLKKQRKVQFGHVVVDSSAISADWHFGRLAFRQIGISADWHFGRLTFR